MAAVVRHPNQSATDDQCQRLVLDGRVCINLAASAVLRHMSHGDRHAVAADTIFINIDAKAGPVEAIHMAFCSRRRGHRNVLGKTGVRERQSPCDVGNDRGDMQRRSAGDARLSCLA